MPGVLHTFNISELIPDALLVIDEHGKILNANKNAEVLFGYTKAELYKLTVEDLMPERYRSHHIHQRDSFHKNATIKPMGIGRDLFILTKNGKEIPTEIALSPASQKNLSRYCRHKTIALLHDVSKRKEYENTIYNLAYYDHLTKLPNRTSFYKNSQLIIEHVEKEKHNLAFMLLDIRELKKINDTLGHFVGDDVIQRTAMILSDYIDQHECGCEKHITLYNISGNEFLFLVEYTKEGTQCIEDIASELINVFKIPATIEGQSLDMHININMGISILSIHGMTSSQLLKTADIALIKAKQKGKNNYSLYNNALNNEFNNFITYENAIKYFIKTNDFDIHYQPVWNIKTKKYVGAEVLFRCNEKRFPNLHVDFLINVAESTGLIVPLGNAILERACIESKEHDLLCDKIIISVNASVQQLEDKKFTDTVCSILKKTGMNPNKLAIEITETTLMNHEAQAIEKVKHLRKQGIRIYIDDFGKGFSSLAYLHKIPADKLKIDMSFLEGIESGEHEILSGIIELGHAIELIVCTEGVETKTQLDILETLGCDEIQGFYKGKPTPAHQLKEIYKEMYITCDEN